MPGGFLRLHEADVQELPRRQPVELVAHLGQAEAPAFQPVLQVPALRLAAARHYEQVDVAARTRRPLLGAAEEVHGVDAEPRGIEGAGEALGESLSPVPVLRRRADPFAPQLPLLPLEV